MAIMLRDLITLGHPDEYKLHLACENKEGKRPLDEYVTSRQNWLGWNSWRGSKDDWTRPYIFSLIEFYPRADRWLFGGIFKVMTRGANSYELESAQPFEKFEGRLLLAFKRYQGLRGRAFYLEQHFDSFEVAEIFPTPYAGEAFCGCADIEHGFGTLEPIFRSERNDWKAALSGVKGVYLICDRSNGRKYVGSAYGASGIWSRWACYIGTGHGWNDELTRLIGENGIEYARKNFVFSILEALPFSAPDQAVIEREGHWKRALLSREFGYNRN